MLEIHFAARVLDVEIAAVFQDVGGGHFPSSVVLFAFVPPGDAVCEFIKLNRLGLGVVLTTLGQCLLVVPDIFGGTGTVKEDEIGWNAGVRCEDAVRQADDGVEIKVLQQFFLDAGTDAIAEEGAVGDDHTRSAAL